MAKIGRISETRIEASRQIGRASCRESVDLGGRRIIKKKKKIVGLQAAVVSAGFVASKNLEKAGRMSRRRAEHRLGHDHLALYFFFSSRRRHTRSLCDWSSDVCSSDLGMAGRAVPGEVRRAAPGRDRA